MAGKLCRDDTPLQENLSDHRPPASTDRILNRGSAVAVRLPSQREDHRRQWILRIAARKAKQEAECGTTAKDARRLYHDYEVGQRPPEG